MSPLSAKAYGLTQPDERKIVFIPFAPQVKYRIAILTPAHKPLSRLAQAFAERLKKEAQAIVKD